MKTYIKGNYRKSIYASEKGYMIGLFKVRDTNDEKMVDFMNKTITFTGYFHELNEDDSYLFYGEAIDHPKYGFQYQVSEYERVKPEGKDGLIEFLSSDLFPGIGEKMAIQIVETLGDNTIEKILENVENLMQVPKLSYKKAKKIYDILTKYEESHKTIVYLSDLGFTMRDALTIYNTYKGNTIRLLEYNIFSFLDDIQDLSFVKLDEISKKMQMERTDDRRIKACIVYMMKELTFSLGDTYLTFDEIIKKVTSYLALELDETAFATYLNELYEDGKIIIEQDHYYLVDLYEAETNVINKLHLLSHLETTKYKKIDEMLTLMEEGNQISYNEKQKTAIKKALENNILIITGGPGTGKTTIIKAIVELYQHLNELDYDELVERCALLAPTGRASKRMSEATLLPATTIHRFLKWNKETNQFGVNEYEKDHSHLIIIDEVSMIDTMLFDSLLKGLTNNIKLILVGDYNQLPSVGPGQILKDLIESQVVDTIELDLLYRQTEESYITTLAHEIKENQLSETFLETKSDYTFLKCQASSIRKNLRTLCEQIVEKGYDYKRVQVMAPMYAGENGIDQLNRDLQDVFNPADPSKKEITVGNIIFREHDKILQLVNMPDENIFNGDIGVIERIIYAEQSDSKKNEIYVDYDGNLVKYTAKDFGKIKHGFIISIHKSQGSEFEVVVMPITMSYRRMLYRKLIYTGITRAKKKLILVGEPMAFISSVENNNEYMRRTSLLAKLVENQNNFQ